ncbi:MAG: ATP-binding cassette sub-family E member 1 [Amphiamblys sp. WSBS2006]|nr:MAG: ATP-binding cassette sub-family E member 1 [Amphiamblys sp. WSBS2006]
MTADKNTRIAIVNAKKCKPRKCGLECKRSCPVNKVGKKCIEVEKTSQQPSISEILCIGCGICIKKCPFKAIRIVNLPSNLEKETTHRYGRNGFKLHRLPIPRAGQVLGLVGTNGIGKSTALRMLAGGKPNLGQHDTPPGWGEILRYFRGSELQGYFTKMLEEKLTTVTKPQFVEQIARVESLSAKSVGEVLDAGDERGLKEEMVQRLGLSRLLKRKVSQLSGGELQRFAIAVTCCKKADVFMFDEPSSYLDIKQRLEMASCIRSIVTSENYVIVVEHDLCVLDYLSDYASLLYGVPGAYGVVSFPYGIREAINYFLAGKIPTDNVRFREDEIVFRMGQGGDANAGNRKMFEYGAMTKVFDEFTLSVEPGHFSESEIVVLLGENGMGKTTFIQMLAGLEAKTEGADVPEMKISYKPQKMSARSTRKVREVLEEKIGSMLFHSQFKTDVLNPFGIEDLLDSEMKNLSGGELQRVAITICLGTPANIYLIDEPSAYLDAEQRMVASKVIRRFVINTKKTAFVVEHDFIMATYLADTVIVYSGTPGVHGVAGKPQGVVSGMNQFLASIEVTFRRERGNLRPRVNKRCSVKDREQKASGDYFFPGTD